MEVFIREKSCETCPFANKEKPNFICGDAIANDIGLKTNFSVCKLNYFANEENCPLKSLDQHDAEVRKPLEEEIERLRNKYENMVSKKQYDKDGLDLAEQYFLIKRLEDEIDTDKRDIKYLEHELETYKRAWERFIDFFATKDCEWDAWESGGAIYGDACFHSGHGHHKKYREKYEKEQKDCLDQARKELEDERK